MTLRPLLAYAPWHARDVLPRALVPLAVFAIVGGLPVFGYLRNQEIIDLANNATQADFVRAMFREVLPLAITLGAFLFMTQSVALDRDRQHTRFFFAHQVLPDAFYLQRFVVGLVVFVACFAPVPLVMQWLLPDLPVLGAFGALVIALVLVGGLTVLAGSLTRRDGLAVILTFIVVRTLQQLSQADVLADWADPIVRGMPPIQTMAELQRAFLTAAAFQWTDVVHVVGYGLGLLAAGLLVVRRSPLVR
ncbi:MAG: hypothetical protein KF689_01715 [Gemmatimonadaceae bacterium]|nr:hypothetical protein [Gemmatimonadaceae bacterium]MCW5826647.1 hypothetical protein [Gemmatimonadaceae bacterium]